MSLAHLDADFASYAAAIRTRLRAHWSHQFTVSAHRTLDAFLARCEALGLLSGHEQHVPAGHCAASGRVENPRTAPGGPQGADSVEDRVAAVLARTAR